MRLSWTVLVLLLLLPVASAQSEAAVLTSVEPAELEVDPRVEQTVRVHVEGAIECLPGMPAPTDVVLQPNPAARRAQTASGPEVHFAFEPEVLQATWKQDPTGPGRYLVDEDFTVEVVSDQYSLTADEVEVSWQGFGGDPESGAEECDPAGYVWVARGVQNLTLTLRTGPPLPDHTGTGGAPRSESTPSPTLLPLALVAVATALRRR